MALSIGLSTSWMFSHEEILWYEKTLITTASISTVYSRIGTIIFYCIGWLAVCLFKDLRTDIQLKRHWSLKAQLKMEQQAIFEYWRERYCLCAELVCRFERVFGFFLLVTITSTFVSTVSTSFYSVTLFQKGGTFGLNEIFVLIAHVKTTIEFCVIAYLPCFIRWQVVTLSSVLVIASLLAHFYRQNKC